MLQGACGHLHCPELGCRLGKEGQEDLGRALAWGAMGPEASRGWGGAPGPLPIGGSTHTPLPSLPAWLG